MINLQYFQIEDNFAKSRHVNSVLIKGDFATPKPMVSIVIPTYKRPDTLKEAIDSALQQKNYDAYEIIVVDNEVEENTATQQLIQSYNNEKIFYYKNQRNLGMTGNWNRGIELARGQWINLLHDDDYLHEDFLQTFNNILRKNDNKNIDFLSFNVKIGNAKVLTEFRQRHNAVINSTIETIKPQDSLVGIASAFPAVLFKKELAVNIGGFFEQAFPVADYVFWTQCYIIGNAFRSNATMGFYRLSDFSETSRIQKGYHKYDLELKAELYDILQRREESFRYFIFYYIGFIEKIIYVRKRFKLGSLEDIEDFFEVKLKCNKSVVRIACSNRATAKTCRFVLLCLKHATALF